MCDKYLAYKNYLMENNSDYLEYLKLKVGK